MAKFLTLIACLWIATSSVSAEQGRSGSELLTIAERSFSDIPFGTIKPPPDLTLVDDGGCIDGRGECTYVDANHVQHYFGDSQGALVVKSIEVAHVGHRHIAALGIGTARMLDEVVERVRRFLPEAEVDCERYPGSDEPYFICGATLGEGWITLHFDRSRRLTEVKIDAYHFT